jgi:hypothetical protein
VVGEVGQGFIVQGHQRALVGVLVDPGRIFADLLRDPEEILEVS